MNRRWDDYVPWVTMALTVLLFAYLLRNDEQSWNDRRKLHEDNEKLRREAGMTREMLNARAEIQVLLILAARDRRPLTPGEVERIDALCVAAQYHHIGGCRPEGVR